jgi:hypothetical protein
MFRTLNRAIIMLTVAAGTTLVSQPAAAQDVPEGWQARLDRAEAPADAVRFQVMEPGWHVTTGRAGSGIFWQPDVAAGPELEARAVIHLMSPAPHPEAFGLFIGGRDLDTPDQEYLYFVVRQTGEYLIRIRRGTGTEDVVGWTAHEAIPVAGDGPATYSLEVAAVAANIAFAVNGTTVHTLPATGFDTEGLVGLRINHMLDVHVEEFNVESR